MSDINQLEAWLAQEREVTARLDAGAGPGVARPEQIAGMNGLQMMEAMLRGELPYAEIARTLSFQIMEVSPGRALFQGTPGPEHRNPMGGIHGGWYATLLDSALGCAVHTTMPPGRGYIVSEDDPGGNWVAPDDQEVSVSAATTTLVTVTNNQAAGSGID